MSAAGSAAVEAYKIVGYPHSTDNLSGVNAAIVKDDDTHAIAQARAYILEIMLLNVEGMTDYLRGRSTWGHGDPLAAPPRIWFRL